MTKGCQGTGPALQSLASHFLSLASVSSANHGNHRLDQINGFPESMAGLYLVGDLFKDRARVPSFLEILVQWSWDVSFKKMAQRDCAL